MGGRRDPVWRKVRDPVEAPQSEGDFYMATYRDGRIRKVGCKMKEGPPLRVRRVLDFNSKAERAKEQALNLKRKELGTGFELQAQALGGKEMTLAEVFLEMKRKRAEEGLATVQRQAPSSSKQATSTSKKTPVAQTAAVEEVAEETCADEDPSPVAVEEELHVRTKDNPPQKKRKRKSTSKQPEVQASSPEASSPEASTASDNLTLAEWLRKSVASTTAVVASDDASIRVFQRRKVKSKALRRRPSKAEPAEDERPPSPVTVCENLCDCDECMPNDTPTPKSARKVIRLTRCPRMENSIISIDAEDREELSTHETREGEFEALPLPEITPADPVFHETEIEEQFLEAFCPEAVSEEKPLIIEVPAPSSDGLDKLPEATPALPDIDMSDVVKSSETRPEVVEEISPAGDTGHYPAESSITSMELEYTENRIDALLDTLVTPDELLPMHLSASKSNKKSKKKKSLCETVNLDTGTANDGSASNPIFQKQEENLTELISLNLRERILKSVTVSFPSPINDAMEDTQGLRSQPTEVVDLTSSVMEVPATEGSEELLDEAQSVSKEHGHAPDSVASFDEAETPTPMDCVTNEEVIFPEESLPTLLNVEEQSPDTSMVTLDVVEVTVTPPSSPVKSIEDAVCNEDLQTDLDASERDLGAPSTSTSKALFTNLTSDSLSKRNRKSFSPNSRLKLIEAARTEGSTPTFRIKLMKSKMRDGHHRKVKSRKAIVLQDDQGTLPEDASAQESFQPETEQNPSPVPEPAENGSPVRITPESSTRPGSPEFQNELSESLQTQLVSTPDKSVNDLSEGCLTINIECRPDSPSGFCTPNAKGDSPLQPKSILKTRSVDPDTRCRGVCRCPRCISTRDQSEAARDFIKSQMIMANNITTKLISELRNMRATVEEGEATPSCQTPTEKAKEALESATKAETWATKEILKLSRDSKRVCRLIETGPRRTIFADDAGKQLCHVKFLPAKKNTVVNF